MMGRSRLVVQNMQKTIAACKASAAKHLADLPGATELGLYFPRMPPPIAGPIPPIA